MIFSHSKPNKINSNTYNEIVSLDLEFFPFAWSEKKWSEIVDLDYYYLFYDSEVDCFAIFQVFDQERYVHLLKIVVHPKLRKRGVASQLLSLCSKYFSDLGIERCLLEVEEENQAAQGLYIKNGFKVIHKQKNFYSNGAMAHIMEKSFI